MLRQVGGRVGAPSTVSAVQHAPGKGGPSQEPRIKCGHAALGRKCDLSEPWRDESRSEGGSSFTRRARLEARTRSGGNRAALTISSVHPPLL